MAWPKGRKRRATHRERAVDPASVDEEERPSMGTQVIAPKHQGVDVDHPSIVSMITNMVKQGRRTEEIMRTVGMPREVIEQIEHREKKR